jgi:hypothetical protein
MTEGKITERSLYPPLNKYLEDLGFDSVSEIYHQSGQLDILAKFNEESFIIEIKIGDKSKKLIEGLSQAMRYANDHNTHNIIVINYLPEVRSTSVDDLDYHALNSKVNSLVLTDYLNYSKDITPKSLFSLLKKQIVSQQFIASDLKTVIRIISESIQEINSTLRKISEEDMEKLIKLITGKFDLFMALSELKKKDEVKDMALNLIGYLIVNQMLFYHVYGKKSGLIPELQELKYLQDLNSQFKHITDINYKTIYQIDLITKLPENPEIKNSLNNIIQIFKIVKPESIEHDLIGRLFHDLLPFETRKILAAFYTNPIAAEILADLIIDKTDVSVIDPACGSGTLLVSAYKRKKQLADDFNQLNYHKQFVEEDLTGLDLMPFAAHLTAINLSSQSIDSTTDKLNVGVMDSLSLSDKLKNKKIYTVQNFSRELQTTLHLFSPTKKSLTEYTSSASTGAVTADGDTSEFKIRKNSFNVCIANPPFSDREKMPNSYLEVLNSYTEINQICGSQINLWGYFIALCDKILKKEGILGFVIPINIFRGKATQKIRDHILENYSIKYIVKTGKNTAFSENASLRDILLIAEKRTPKKRDKTRFVIINEDLHDLSFDDAHNIAKYIKGGAFTSGKNLDMIDYDYELLLENKDNLMPLFGLMNTKSGEVLGNFNAQAKKRFDSVLRKINDSEVSEGFHASPAGLSQMAFITNNFAPNRIKRAFLILKKEHSSHLDIGLKGLPEKTFRIDKSILKPAFRTLTDINNFDITNKLDNIIIDDFEDSELVLNLSNFKNKSKFSYDIVRKKMESKWTYMVTARRFRPNSKNTSLFAFCSEKKFIAPHTFKNIYFDLDSAKINCLYLNSVMGILNLILLKEQTTEAYTDIMESDLILFDIIDTRKIDSEQKNDLLSLYDDLKTYDFPSLTEQFENQFEGRVKLDSTLLNILGFNRDEIEEILPEVYDSIAFELKNG